MTTIEQRLRAVQARVAAAAKAAGRDPASVRLLAVSKTWPADAVREAAAAGQRAFGENYVQEGVAKVEALRGSMPKEGLDGPLEWHFIGPLQSNKTRSVANAFDWVHSIDRLKIAERLSAQRDVHLPPLNVCIQVNVSGEDSKSGVAPDEAAALAKAVAALPRLRLRGLMCIPEPTDDAALLRSRFALLRALKAELADEGLVLDTLSMGMSHDVEPAVAEGATMVRVGTAIFGERTRPAAQA
ncbi:YggS family pyridoxal phosphate-dependent enzyme [Thauera butanivorans]|uniref:YggS family pyridoxal phosphate-dependent enzyme n=1 Tax=Thauera butanivorans TaxID=86174 RepID=UPI003AB73850